ncbi:hypothetical protein [Paraburkholderia kururiensis]|uniref:Transmembrane protein n=1 Tax=Paraburkholderia kururiensis TaxID=984307 RepID=A0ABZ0WRR1_9BURK|nr:hypothetical protein [Paraburkholderia kururiensis]WQD79954.1 hypothetical protein U0042_09880 [Paraburkholderia kururiensis]
MAGSLSHDDSRLPLRWRMPWLAWQSLSWAVLTVLAPPFWAVGMLLVINAHSDQPLFWAATMAIVPIAHGIAIVMVNQLHHRARFTSRRAVALRFFLVSMAVCCVLFVAALWATGAGDALLRPLVETAPGTRIDTLVLPAACVAAAFGISSSAHASIVHAWLAFEA